MVCPTCTPAYHSRLQCKFCAHASGMPVESGGFLTGVVAFHHPKIPVSYAYLPGCVTGVMVNFHRNASGVPPVPAMISHG